MTRFLEKSFSFWMPGKKAVDWPWPPEEKPVQDLDEKKDESPKEETESK